MLAQVTGGILKPEKCGVYFLAYRLVKGKARLKWNKDLPDPMSHVTLKDGKQAPSHLTVPQLDGGTALIPTIEVTETLKELGFFFNPAGDGAHH